MRVMGLTKISVREIFDKVTHTQSVLIDLPNTYDLAECSCVNQEVGKTNMELTKLSVDYRVPTGWLVISG